MLDLLKLAGVFVIIVVLLRRGVNFGFAMLAGSVSLGLLFAISPLNFGQAVLTASTDRATINLVVALLLIMALENVLRRTGMLAAMVEALASLIGDRRVVMATLPALLGFLPSPGGARFSAPMVEQAGLGLGLSPERMSFINYWYRHVWEFSLPLYPSMILASQLLGVPLSDLVVLFAPFTALAIVAGAPFAFRGIGEARAAKAETSRRSQFGALLSGASPILLVTGLVVLLHLDLSVAMLAVVAALLVVHRYSAARLVALAREALSWKIIAMVFAIFIFKEVLIRSGAIESLLRTMESAGIPVLSVAFAVPFLIGLATGYAQAPVAAGLPLVLGLVQGQPFQPGLIGLAFVAGFAGVMLSPAHLCLVLTVQHFKASMILVLRACLVPELLIIAFAVALAFLR